MQFWVWVWMNLLFLIEAALVGFAFFSSIRFGRLGGAFRRLARSRYAPLAAGAAAIVLRLAVLPIEPAPRPAVHDEFSYLLAADTFLHGRLANPAHAMWQHFETMQIDQQPTYASMYPPLQGLVLAAGAILTGHPFAGVCLSLGLMCGALCWALRGWFPPTWALLAALLAAIRICMFSYWADSYWGGALAAAGGALLFGAIPRFARRSRARDAAIAAIGIAMLANTRPFEGAAFTVGAALVLLPSVRRLKLRTIALAAAAVLVPVAAGMAYYNWRAFGSPGTFPYAVNRSTYAVSPYFLFQSPSPQPQYRHASIRDYYVGWELPVFLGARSAPGYLSVVLFKLRVFWLFYVGPALTIPLVAAAWTWRSRRTRVLVLMAGVLAIAMSPIPFFVAHYAAPATVLVWGLVIQGLRALRRWRPGLANGIPAVCVLMAGIRIAMALVPIPFVLSFPMTWAATWSPHLERDAISRRLHAMGGQHLVIVHYRPGHDPLKEYVFNRADIDASEIVWAHDMGPDRDSELCRYFRSRRVWWLDADAQPPQLSAYPL